MLMGGVRNDAFNFVRHNLAGQTEYVLRNWPTPIVVSQEVGDIHTGAALRTAPAENPVRGISAVVARRGEGSLELDQVAVLYGVRGLGDYFEEVAAGEGRLRSGFAWDMQPGWRTFLALRVDKQAIEAAIEALMVAPPLVRFPAQHTP